MTDIAEVYMRILIRRGITFSPSNSLDWYAMFMAELLDKGGIASSEGIAGSDFLVTKDKAYRWETRGEGKRSVVNRWRHLPKKASMVLRVLCETSRYE